MSHLPSGTNRGWLRDRAFDSFAPSVDEGGSDRRESNIRIFRLRDIGNNGSKAPIVYEAADSPWHRLRANGHEEAPSPQRQKPSPSTSSPGRER